MNNSQEDDEFDGFAEFAKFMQEELVESSDESELSTPSDTPASRAASGGRKVDGGVEDFSPLMSRQVEYVSQSSDAVYVRTPRSMPAEVDAFAVMKEHISKNTLEDDFDWLDTPPEEKRAQKKQNLAVGIGMSLLSASIGMSLMVLALVGILNYTNSLETVEGAVEVHEPTVESRQAKDTFLKADLWAVATTLEELVVENPEAKFFDLTNDNVVSPSASTQGETDVVQDDYLKHLLLWVGTELDGSDAVSEPVSVAPETSVRVRIVEREDPADNFWIVEGFHAEGYAYSADEPMIWDSRMSDFAN